jgi:TonB-linked SusC/RagA family outer membrane protein
VVVTALGIKRAQKALSYNVQEIKGEELTGVKDINFMNSLSGKVAGVNINASAAGIGGATRVVMRGSKSITKDNNALYVIDGVPIFNTNKGGLDMNNEYATQPRGEGIADLNPEDIESMSVLTGPAAAALYGSNAANGAIIITTRKGAMGKPKVTISNQTTFSRPFVMPEFQNRYGNRPGEYRSWGDKQSIYSYDPKDFFDTGATVQTSATLSVGTDKNQTYMSLGSTSANGIIPENDYLKYNVTLRNTTKFLNDKMTLDFGFSYIKQKDKNMMAQGQYYNPLTAVYTYPRGEDFGYARNYEVYDDDMRYNVQQWKWKDQGLAMQNPYWVINRNQMINKRDRYMMNVNLQYDILDWLNVMGRTRLDNAYNAYTQKNYATTDKLFAPETGRYKSTKEDYKQVYADLLVNINKYFGDYSLSANIGTSISDMRSDEAGVDGSLQIPNFFAITNIDKNAAKTTLIQNGWHEQTQSVFANLELGWKSMLYLTLTGRSDWASALAKTSSSSFFYPSVGLSGVISEMVKMPDFISYMKVRGSYSSVGSAVPRNLSIPTYVYDAQGGNWNTITNMPIYDLKPERTGSWEAGLSTKFWGNRLSLDLTWYKSNTKNQTLNVPISASTWYTSMYVQTGNVENQGVEITLGADNRWGDFSWNSTFTASYNQNTIKELGEYPDPFTKEKITLGYVSQGGIGASEFRLYKGGTMGDLYIKKKLRYDENGSVVLNENGTPAFDDVMDKVGSVLPKWNLGFRNDFRYKNLTFGFHVSARLGGIVVSPTQAILDGFGVSEASAAARDRGGVVIGNTTIGAEQYYTATGQTEGLLSNYVYKATNVRLQELSVGYNLPARWFSNLMKVNVSFVGHNLWMIYNKAPFDPEMTASTGTYFQGIDYFMQPSLRNLGFSVKVDF